MFLKKFDPPSSGATYGQRPNNQLGQKVKIAPTVQHSRPERVWPKLSSIQGIRGNLVYIVSLGRIKIINIQL